MRVTNIGDLLGFEPEKVIKSYNKKVSDYYILWVINIFLDKDKNKYKNTKPLPCVIKYGSRWRDDDTNFCLITTEKDIWSEYYRYNCIDKIDEILLNGEALDRGSLTFKHKFPNLKLFTTKKEAYECIDNYKKQNDIIKYKEKLSRITTDINILIKEKERLEILIKQIEENEDNN